MIEIVKGLYLGDIADARNFIILDTAGINNIISLTDNKFYPNKYKYITYNIKDNCNVNIIEICKYTAEYIEEQLKNGKKIFVHCRAGVSRSVSIVLSYLIIKLGMSFTDAYNMVKSKRFIIHPNDGFIYQLKYLDSIYNGNVYYVQKNNSKLSVNSLNDLKTLINKIIK